MKLRITPIAINLGQPEKDCQELIAIDSRSGEDPFFKSGSETKVMNRL